MEKSLATIMLKVINDEEFDISEGILSHPEGVDLLPGNIELSGLEISLTGVISRETILREYVNRAREKYDYIIIDCMPSLGMLTINALFKYVSAVDLIPQKPRRKGCRPHLQAGQGITVPSGR